MNIWPKQNTKDLTAFYGDPDANDDGRPDIAWEAVNITRIIPPYPMFLAWNGRPLKTISIHRKCADSLMRCLLHIADIPEANRRHYGLDQFGGAYNFRPMRGVSQLSTHAYGCAIDLAPVQNPLYKAWQERSNMMPPEVVKIFQAEGWAWGGDWDGDHDLKDQRRHDGMHFQAARL